MEIKQEKRLTDFFKALANPWRLRMIGLLSEKDYSVQELCEALDKSQPVVSRHLYKLRLVGILEFIESGREHRYYINKEKTKTILTDARDQLFRS